MHIGGFSCMTPTTSPPNEDLVALGLVGTKCPQWGENLDNPILLVIQFGWFVYALDALDTTLPE